MLLESCFIERKIQTPLHRAKIYDTVLFAYSAQMYFSTEFNEIFVLLLFYFLASHGFKICQMNNKIIQLFLCSRYDVRIPFRIQTLSSLPWLQNIQFGHVRASKPREMLIYYKFVTPCSNPRSTANLIIKYKSVVIRTMK